MADRVDPAGRVYANALHQAATEAGKVQDVDRDLEGFISALGENEVLLRALVNPALPREAKRRVLARVLDQADPLARNAVLVLADHGRLELLVDMQTAYAELAAEDEQILKVELTTAVELEKKDLDALTKRITEAVGRQAQVTATVDPNLIGGLVLKAGSLEVDSSVRGRLDRLRRDLAHAST